MRVGRDECYIFILKFLGKFTKSQFVGVIASMHIIIIIPSNSSTKSAFLMRSRRRLGSSQTLKMSLEACDWTSGLMDRQRSTSKWFDILLP